MLRYSFPNQFAKRRSVYLTTYSPTAGADYTNALSVVGAGKLNLIKITSTTGGMHYIRITVDGTIIQTYSKNGAISEAYLFPIHTANAASNVPANLDYEFKSSLLVEMKVDTGGTMTGNILYEKE